MTANKFEYQIHLKECILKWKTDVDDLYNKLEVVQEAFQLDELIKQASNLGYQETAKFMSDYYNQILSKS
jgi:hypothetical protein